MQTVSVNVMSLCVPCENRCRYCLLSYNGKENGADYNKSKEYALNFSKWIKENRPELSFLFGFGYSMEHPKLMEEIKFLQSIGSASGEFLQLDGMKIRGEEELKNLLKQLKENGIKLIDLTFYGERDYHDKFAGRKGDFDYMINILKASNEIELDVEIGVAVTDENAEQIDRLIEKFTQFKTKRLFLFVPHCEGRGESLNNIRFSEKGFSLLNEKSRKALNREIFKTESEWLASEYKEKEKRMICITLTKENFSFFNEMSFDKAISYVEKLDDNYYNAIPSFSDLASIYGEKQGCKFYSQRDLFLKYQKLYIKDNRLNVYDVNDERQCFTRRF